MKRGSGCCAVDIYCTAASTSFSDSISYITYLFSEWRIGYSNTEVTKNLFDSTKVYLSGKLKAYLVLTFNKPINVHVFQRVVFLVVYLDFMQGVSNSRRKIPHEFKKCTTLFSTQWGKDSASQGGSTYRYYWQFNYDAPGETGFFLQSHFEYFCHTSFLL